MFWGLCDVYCAELVLLLYFIVLYNLKRADKVDQLLKGEM